ncbi:MAG TPA: hypothetical protein EYP58_06200 [bacterium (Candidatus Stahlbacteria)]|nr:hypothetical protein [Candidatus Stahlbacteria bacterium]
MDKTAVLLILCLAIVIRIPLINHNFISDDYISLAKPTMASPKDLFFRPIQTAVFTLNKMLFGLNPLGWNLMSLFFHLTNLYLIIRFTRLLFDYKGITLLSGLLFSVHFIHNEPIYWFSAILTLMTATFLLLTIITYIKNRSRILPITFFILALLTKETAITIPFVLIIISLFQKLSLKRTIPFFLILGGYLLIRISSYNPIYQTDHYALSLSPINTFKNFTFLFSGLTVWIDYRLLHNLWYQTDGLSVMMGKILDNRIIVFSLISSWMLFLIPLIKGSRRDRFAIVLTVVLFLPFLFLRGSGERFLYIPSIGSALLVSLLINRLSNPGRLMVVCALAIYLGLFSLTTGHRWIAAGRQAGEIVYFLKKVERTLPYDSKIYFVNPPEEIEGAWVFKNGLEYIDELYFTRSDVEVIPVRIENIDPGHGDKVIIWEAPVD